MLGGGGGAVGAAGRTSMASPCAGFPPLPNRRRFARRLFRGYSRGFAPVLASHAFCLRQNHPLRALPSFFVCCRLFSSAAGADFFAVPDGESVSDPSPTVVVAPSPLRRRKAPHPVRRDARPAPAADAQLLAQIPHAVPSLR